MGFIGRRNPQTDGRTHRAIEESLRRHRRVEARSTDLRKLLEGTVNVLVFLSVRSRFTSSARAGSLLFSRVAVQIA